MPDIQSPAGPTAIRSPAFQLSGCCTLALKDVNREQFALLGVRVLLFFFFIRIRNVFVLFSTFTYFRTLRYILISLFFLLNCFTQISSHSPLEGHLRMRISRKVSVSVEHRGFLTFFKDVTNLPAWCRRWCWLKDAKLYYWEYPEDEHKKNPIGHLDLEGN